MVAPIMLTGPEVAARLGIKPKSWSRYCVRREAPPADEYVGRTPRWKTSTIDRWEKARPGYGKPNGRYDRDAVQAKDDAPEPAPVAT